MELLPKKAWKPHHQELWDIFDRIYCLGQPTKNSLAKFLSQNQPEVYQKVIHKKSLLDVLNDSFVVDGKWDHFLIVDEFLIPTENWTPSYLRKISKVLTKLNKKNPEFLLHFNLDPNFKHYCSRWLTNNICQFRSNSAHAFVISNPMMKKLRKNLKSFPEIKWDQYSSFTTLPSAWKQENETAIKMKYQQFIENYIKYINIPLIQLRWIVAILLIMLVLLLAVKTFPCKKILLAILIVIIVIIIVIKF